jgi:hypothetical protein
MEAGVRAQRLKSASYAHQKALVKMETFKKAQAFMVSYFKDLRRCWLRLQSRQLAEYEALGIDCSELVPIPFGLDGEPFKPPTQAGSPREDIEGTQRYSMQSGQAGEAKGFWLQAEGKTQEGQWKVEKPRREQVQKAQDTAPFWRSQLGGKGVDPTQLSASRGPPTNRPPDTPPPWKGAVGGSV